MTQSENLPPGVVSKLFRELQSIESDRIDGVQLVREATLPAGADSLSEIVADVSGPEGTPYEGGVFRMKLALVAEYPAQPPRGYFCTKIFHPNVSERGEICVDTLKRDWQPTYGIRHILTVVRCLLIDPNPESALNEEAGRLLLEDYEAFAAHARTWTRVHASPRVHAATAGAANEGASDAEAAAENKEAPGTSPSPATTACPDVSPKDPLLQVMRNTGSPLREKRRSLKRL